MINWLSLVHLPGDNVMNVYKGLEYVGCQFFSHAFFL